MPHAWYMAHARLLLILLLLLALMITVEGRDLPSTNGVIVCVHRAIKVRRVIAEVVPERAMICRNIRHMLIHRRVKPLAKRLRFQLRLWLEIWLIHLQRWTRIELLRVMLIERSIVLGKRSDRLWRMLHRHGVCRSLYSQVLRGHYGEKLR
eukprot:COSAG02_NODE_248_length_27133_cov_45.131723_28_plen_151_part_00